MNSRKSLLGYSVGVIDIGGLIVVYGDGVVSPLPSGCHLLINRGSSDMKKVKYTRRPARSSITRPNSLQARIFFLTSAKEFERSVRYIKLKRIQFLIQFLVLE